MGKTHWSVRALSLILAVCLLLGTVPAGTFTLPVFAAADSTVDTTSSNVTKVKEYAQTLLAENYTKASTATQDETDAFSWDSEGKKDDWRYYNGVMLDAFIQLGVSTGDTTEYTNALTFLDTFMDANVADNGVIAKYSLHEVDSVPPALSLFYLIDSAAHQDKYEKAATIVYNELEKQYTYSSCGGNYLHKQTGYDTGVGASGWDVWNIGLDGLYMAEPFLMAYANALESGSITNSNASAAEIYEEVYDRFIWVAENMYDEATGLYHHGWSVNGGTHTESSGTYAVTAGSGNGHFWGRGIGWYAVGLVEVIDRMPNATYKAGLIDALEKLFDGMLKYQDSETGMWYNVVNRDSSLSNNLLETSVTSLMAYALLKAYNEGWVTKNDYAVAGLNAFNGLVDNKYVGGKFTDIYLKSGVGMTDEYYCGTYAENEAKGVGAILMAASEALEAADKLHGTTTDAAKEEVTIGMVTAPQPMVIASGSQLDTSGITATVDTNQGTVKTLPGSALTYEYTNTTSAEQEDITVTVKYNGVIIDTFPAKLVNTANTETGTVVVADTPEIPSTGVRESTVSVVKYVCELDKSDYSSDFFTAAKEDGDANWKENEYDFSYTSTSGVTYQIDRPLKFESKTTLSFNAIAEGSLLLVFHEKAIGKTVKVDDVAYTIGTHTDGNGVVTVSNLVEGSHIITRGGDETWLGYIEYSMSGCAITLTANSEGEVLQSGGTAILTATLSATVGNEAVTVSGDVSWKSDNTGVATVSGGTVSAVGTGAATVTATVDTVIIDDHTAYLDTPLVVSVPIAVAENTQAVITLSASLCIIDRSTWVTVGVNVGDQSYVNGDLESDSFAYVSSNEAIATVSGGNRDGVMVSAVNPGVCTIYATLKEVPYNSVMYTLPEPITVGIPVVISGEAAVNYMVASVDAETYSIQVGDKTNVSAVVTDGTQAVTEGYTLSWASGDTTIATVDSDGVVTGLKAGTVTITATVSGSTTATYSLSQSASVEITVTEEAENWVDCTNYFLEEKSQGYEITEEIQTWTFTSVTSGTDIWDTPVLLIDRQQSGETVPTTGIDMIIRSDDGSKDGRSDTGAAWSDTGTSIEKYSNETIGDTDAWLEANKAGTTCKVTAQIVGEKVVIAISNSGYTKTFVADKPELAEGEELYLYFSGENCVLNNLQTTTDHLDISAAVASITGEEGNLGYYVLNTTGIVPGEKYVIVAVDGSNYVVLGQDVNHESSPSYYQSLTGTVDGSNLIVSYVDGQNYEFSFDSVGSLISVNGVATAEDVYINNGDVYDFDTGANNSWRDWTAVDWETVNFPFSSDDGRYLKAYASNASVASVSAKNISNPLPAGEYYYTFRFKGTENTDTGLSYKISSSDGTVLAQGASLTGTATFAQYTTDAFYLAAEDSITFELSGTMPINTLCGLDDLILYKADNAYNQYGIYVTTDTGTKYYLQGEGNEFTTDGPRKVYVSPVTLSAGTYHFLLQNTNESSKNYQKYNSFKYLTESDLWYACAGDYAADEATEIAKIDSDRDSNAGVLYLYRKEIDEATSVKFQLSPANTVLAKAGDTASLTATVLVDGTAAESSVISWVSSDTSVVTVDETGKVTAVGPGTATVTATLTQANGQNVFDSDENPGISQSVSVTVDSVYTLEITSPQPESGQDAAIVNLVETSWMVWKLTKDGSDPGYWEDAWTGTDYISVEWTSGNEDVVTIEDDGKIIKHGTGTATITGELYVDGVRKDTASVAVTVMAPEISVTDQVLHLGETGRVLTPTVTFNGTTVDAGSYTVTFEVTDGSAVSVDASTGGLTTLSAGGNTVRATITGWKTGETVYEVTDGPSDTALVEVIATTGHEWNTDTVTIYKGGELDLSALELTIHWSDGPADVISGSQLSYTGWSEDNSNTPGTYSIIVSYTVGSATFTKQIQVVVKDAVTGITWTEVEHDAYERVTSIEADTPYVIGRVDENGNFTISNTSVSQIVGNSSYTGLTPVNAYWVEDPKGTQNLYYNMGDAVQYWYFERVSDTEDSYYMYYVDSENEKVYLWQRSDHLGYTGTELFDNLKASKLAISATANSDVFVFSRGISYRGTYGVFVLKDTSDSFYLYGKNGTITTYLGLYGSKSYTYVGGESTAEKILAQIREDYVIFEADGDDGTNERQLAWDNARVELVWQDENGNVIDNVDPDAQGTYALHVWVDGVDISGNGISVTVTTSIDRWSLDKESITVPLNGTLDISERVATAYDASGNVLLTLKGEEIEFDFAGATLNGKTAAVNTSNAGAVYTVPVLHNGEPVYKDSDEEQPLTLTVTVASKPYDERELATEYAGYPAEGSVKMDKNVSTTGTYYNQTGVAQLELTAAGVTAAGAVDVILIVDISNSMAWTDNWFDMSIYNGDYPDSFDNYWTQYQTKNTENPDINAAWNDWTNGVILYDENGEKLADAVLDNDRVSRAGADAPDKLDAAMESAAAFAGILLGENTDNTLSLVTFAGMDHEHNSGRDTIDSVHSVFTGISDAESAIRSFSGIDFYQIDRYINEEGAETGSVGYYLTLTDAEGNILAQGKNRGNTNYDYAFGQAYEAVIALKAQVLANAELNPDELTDYDDLGRQLHVVFMTDGAPSHYNGVFYGSSSADYKWGTTTNYGGYSGDNDAEWLQAYISAYNTLATKLVEEGGLDGFHAVGFDMAHGGFSDHSWQKDDLLGVISGLVRNQVVNVEDASSGDELIEYYTELAQVLTYSGTFGQVTDVIGSDFTLYTGTENEQTVYGDTVLQPPSDMWIKSYRLVTMADVGSTLRLDGMSEDITLDPDNITQYLGKRVMKWDEDSQTYVYDCENLEHLVFNQDEDRNLISYTTTNLKTNETKTVNYTAKGAIDGYFFDYTIDSTGKETITWELGDITDRELALSYYVYLKGSMDDSMDRAGGSYDTNEVATLEYVDNQSRHAVRDYKVPNLPWAEASVTVRFFLVNEDGEYVNFAGTAFESESLRVFLAEYYVYSGLELSGVDYFTVLQAYADAKVTKYPLYDDEVAMTVYRNPSSGGNAFGSGYSVPDTSNNADKRRSSAERIKFVDVYGDGSYVKTVIEIPVVLTEDLGESLQRLESAMVVVDYGKPIDIDVISDNERTYYKTGIRAQDIKDGQYYWYQMEIIGFATYSELHDQKDYVREDSISKTLVTEYGEYSLVTDRDGEVQVRFTPSRFFEEPENVFVGVKFAKYNCVEGADGSYSKGEATSDYFCMYKQLSVVPATVMYYETDFAENIFILHQGNQVEGMNYKAQMGFASDGWGYNDWNNAKATTQIKGPGTYSITLTPSQTVKGVEVLYVDIEGAATALADYTVSNVSMSVTKPGNGGTETVAVDQDKVWFNTYGSAKRLCLYNAAWPDTSESETIYLNPNAISNLADTEFTSLTVTFTLSAGNTASGNETDTDTQETEDAGWTTAEDPETDRVEKVGETEFDHIQNEGPRGKGEQGVKIEYAYGYDSTYSEDNYLSDGDSWFVNGASTAQEIRENTPSTYATFTFQGTGFDLISRTGDQQATLRVHIYQGTEISGTPYKIVSVIDKGANELYQIPVISVNDLPHGTYTVQIIVYESYDAATLPEELREQLARGNEFYFDAIRIYDPVEPETVITQDAAGEDITVDKVYSEDGENEPVIIQIGDLLMDLKDFEELAKGTEGTGAVYMDAHTLTEGDWVSTDMVQQYKDYGPNNEVYLYPGQGIAFILNISDTVPASIQIGAKSIEGTSPTMKVEVASVTSNDGVLNASLTQTVTTSTAMYYKAAYGDGLVQLFGGSKQVYVFIWNESTGTTTNPILSITDIKIGYAVEAPTAPVSIGSSHQLVESAAAVIVDGSKRLVRIDDEWCYCDGDTVLTDYTGLVVTAGSGTWYVSSGKVDFTYSGLYEDTQNAKLYYIRGGMVDSTLNGIASRNGQWMYFEKGVVDLNYTGIVIYGSTGQWYVENGIVRMDFTGTVTIDNTTYTIANGKVTATNS